MSRRPRTSAFLRYLALLLFGSSSLLPLLTAASAEARSIGDGAGIPRYAYQSAGSTSLDQPALAVLDSADAMASSSSRSQPAVEFVVRARPGGPLVRTLPNSAAPVLSGLYFDTYLPIVDQQRDASGVLWYKTSLWGTLPGWIQADETVTGDPPSPTPVSSSSGSGPSGPAPSQRSPVFPIDATGVTNDQFNLRDGSDPGANVVGQIAPSSVVKVQAWQTDDAGSPWYRVVVSGTTAWISAGGVDLQTSSPARAVFDGKPVWTAAAGKGMWLPKPLLEMANPSAIVEAARALGLTQIYLEAGSSSGGFYDRAGVDALLPVAHQAGIKVIGWLLTTLDSVPQDVSLCSAVAEYQTPSGDRLDGIAPDVEFNMDSTAVRAFSQIVRARLGPNEPIVGVIYPAGSWIGNKYPIAGILAHSFNALAPMDYWHDTQRTYTADEIAQFIRETVADIHQAVGDPNYPVAVIGQSYDGFSRNGSGPSNPTGDEVAAALGAAQSAGAVGVSLFQWGTTTPAEWDALRGLQWSTAG